MKYGVFIGRFQPLHLAHQEIIFNALEKYDKLLVIIGSANSTPSLRNPWNDDTRIKMVQSIAPKHPKLITALLEDSNYNFNDWLKNVHKLIMFHLDPLGENKHEINIIGCYKDAGSYWLNAFPHWKLDIVPFTTLNGTDIRNLYFEGHHDWRKNVSDRVQQIIFDWETTGDRPYETNKLYKTLKEEYRYIKDYKASWSKAPFPPIFVTVDCFVICKGNILMIKRGRNPGKDLWALPGGFVDQNEYLKTAAIRELKEETNIDVAKPILESALKDVIVYDNPIRDLRGRTITHTHVFDLNLKQLPNVKAGDDANYVRWLPLGEIDSLKNQFYADHYQIIKNVLFKLES